VSLRTRPEWRCIEAGGLAHGFQRPVPSHPLSAEARFACHRPAYRAARRRKLPESTRNTSASRNRHNSPHISDLIFSTRNKIDGPTRTVVLSDQRESKGSSSFLIISNRYNPGNRNRRNPPDINDINFSNRNKIGGSPRYVAFPHLAPHTSPLTPRTSHIPHPSIPPFALEYPLLDEDHLPVAGIEPGGPRAEYRAGHRSA
jgi:hypothetical protein